MRVSTEPVMTKGLSWWKSEIKKQTFVEQLQPKHREIGMEPIEVTKCECASKDLVNLLFGKSQMRSVLSSPTLISFVPPGWNLRPLTQLSCPCYNTKHLRMHDQLSTLKNQFNKMEESNQNRECHSDTDVPEDYGLVSGPTG